MRVLGVVFYCAVLLCLINYAFAACNENAGAIENKPFCVCNSGFQGTNCDTQLPNTCESKLVDAQTATHFPKLSNSSSFTGNHLHATIVSPFVAGRQFKSLVFREQSNDNCVLGQLSGFWSKALSTETCEDTFDLDLPWVNHTDCGFKVDSTAADKDDFLTIVGKLDIKYEDLIGEDDLKEFNLTRVVSVPYKMSVKFQKKITVELLMLNVTSDVHYGVALTGDNYDPLTGILTLQLTTIINYPNMLNLIETDLIVPNQVEAITGTLGGKANLKVFPYQDMESKLITVGLDQYCNRGKDACTQFWTIRVKINETAANGTEACNFDGNYIVTYNLYTCRPPHDSSESSFDLYCTFSPTNVTFSIATSDICGRIDVTPQVKGELKAFPDTMDWDVIPTRLDDKVSEFKLGSFARFYADVASDGNAIKLNFTDVKFAVKPATGDPADSDWVHIWKNSEHSGVLHMENVHFTTENAKKGFRLYFHSSVFKVNPNERVTYVISANCTILFIGNEGETNYRKRTVEFVYESSAMTTKTKVGISGPQTIQSQGDKIVGGSPQGIDQLTFIGAVVGAVAGTLLIVFVVVGFALRVRNQSEKKDTAASAAIAAAAAAATVANRA